MNALAARVDAFMTDDGDEDGGETIAKPRLQSEPGVEVSMDDVDEGGVPSIVVDLPLPQNHEPAPLPNAAEAEDEPARAASDEPGSVDVHIGGDTPVPRPMIAAPSMAGGRPRIQSEPSEPIEIEDVEEVHEISRPIDVPIPAPTFRPPIPSPRPGAAPPPPPPKIAIPPPRIPKPPAIPSSRGTHIGLPPVAPTMAARGSAPSEAARGRAPSDPPPAMPRTKSEDRVGSPAVSRTGSEDRMAPPALPRTKTDDRVPPPPPPPRVPTGQHAPLSASDSSPKISTEDVLAGAPDITKLDGGVEVGTATPNVVVVQPLEVHLESPTVVDKALAALADSTQDTRPDELSRELEAKVLDEPAVAANLAYELGELYESRADEARAVKAFGRALNLDPSLRPNLWAIRRVFYRRALWPNLHKLVDAEVQYARDDYERADLLLEKARISAHRLNDSDDARAALDEAARIAPTHQGVLLELERVVARSGDVPALLEVWEQLAEAVEQPARKVAYLLEVGRAAGVGGNAPRAYEAFDKAAQLAMGTPAAERVARERLRIAEEYGTPAEVAAAVESLASVLLAAFGPAGPGAEPGTTAAGERPTRATALRLELVALRRRQAQIARKEQPEKSWEYLQQALALSPGEPIVLADLTELAEELGRYDDLAELVQNWQAVEGDPSRAMSLSIRRADALLRGGQGDQARALLASLEAAAPGFIVLTSAAERDAFARNDPEALASTYLTAAHAALLGTWLGPGQEPKPDPQAAATLYIQGAELFAYEVATPEGLDEARAALGKALEAVPDHPVAVEALVELDDAVANVGPALERLRAAAAKTADKTDKRALLERALRLARSHGDFDAMLEIERALVELVPDELPLRWRLESTLAQLGRDDERAELLVKLAADETDAAGRGTGLLAAARLRERAGSVESATELYRQVLALWPDDTFARESLLDLLRAQERWQELVAERRGEAKSLPDGAAARRALREAAWVLECRLEDAAQAAAVYDEWLARFPDDRTALEGLARCRAKFNDRAGEAAARATIAETEPSANATWLYARSLERAGQFDEAADQYRALLANEEPSVAATNATFALGDLAAQRGDTVMRVEATAALAGRTADPRLGAALAEDSGWMYALVLEDAERAAQSFEAAIALDPTRRGAQLGAALVAARRADAPQLALAYEGLAAAVDMPEAAAALLLRGAAMAAAAGDLDLANHRVAIARNAAPDDSSTLLVAAEVGPAPYVEEADGSAAIDPLLARAEVLEMRGALADAASRASWELDRAEALELAGRLREAGAVLSAVLKARPDDLRGLSALRRMARRANDHRTVASAAYALARIIGDPAAKLELLREAAAIYDRPGSAHNADHAVAAYKRILITAPGAPELDRLLELLRERADVQALIQAITDRLTWVDAEAGPVEASVPLLLERATVLHGLGDTEAAMADLDALLDRAPANLEALRFRADLAFNAGDVETAIALWRRYLAAETRPQRRNEIELQLSQVLAENTNDLGGAIEQLERVVETNPDDVGLRERLLGLCLRASDWDRGVRELRQLARMRATPQEKAREELRLGLMLRDRLGDRTSARLALDRARTLDPLNLDVVRELSDLLEPTARAQVLAATAHAVRDSIVQTPARGPLYEKLAQVHAWQADVDARWLALVAVEQLATPSVDQRQVLVQGRQKLVGPHRIKLDDAARRALRAGLGGALHELWRAIAPAVQVASGVDVAKLGFARGDKLAVKKLGDKYEPLATALACFGLEDVEVYINAGRTGFARALAAETPILCVGADVAAAATANNRFVLGRAVATLAEGVATLVDLREGELAWTIAAALRAVDAQLPPALAELVVGEESSIAERAKLLKKELSRKAKAAVVQLAQGKREELAAVEDLRRAGFAVGHRAGLLWASDLGVALSILDVGRGGRSLGDSPAALDLAAWSVSEEHARLRDKLGLSLKGTR